MEQNSRNEITGQDQPVPTPRGFGDSYTPPPEASFEPLKKGGPDKPLVSSQVIVYGALSLSAVAFFSLMYLVAGHERLYKAAMLGFTILSFAAVLSVRDAANRTTLAILGMRDILKPLSSAIYKLTTKLK